MKQDEPIEFLVPTIALDRRLGRKSLGLLGAVLDQLAADTGLDEESLAHEIGGHRGSK